MKARPHSSCMRQCQPWRRLCDEARCARCVPGSWPGVAERARLDAAVTHNGRHHCRMYASYLLNAIRGWIAHEAVEAQLVFLPGRGA